jgi:hypothetical protein
MSKVTRHEDEIARLLRATSKSTAVTWGTTAPFALGQVGFSRIGFADIPVVGCRVYTPSVNSIIAVVRQHILRKVAELGLDDSALDLLVHVGIESRKRKFKDENPSSESHGKNKMGQVVRCHLEITRRDAVPSFQDKLTRIYL